MSFNQLNLIQPILSGIQQCGYTNPTPIQQQAIPVALSGKDIIATSQTGSGKTAAYLIPAIARLGVKASTHLPRILILTPTRELANQVESAAIDLGRHLRINVVSILGGMPYGKQMQQLSRRVDILVATPGRLMDFMERGLDLSKVEMLILDEADRMLDMGFIDDVARIARATPKSRQTLLFTATLGDKLAKLAGNLLNTPERIEIVGKKVTLDNIQQHLHIANSSHQKSQMLTHLLNNEEIDKAIIFSATKRNAEMLADQLREQGFAASALHGDMQQHKRNKMMTMLRNGRINILVATDVAARGIDVPEISHVINYDLPRFAEDYVHRIGRTGRAGRNGVAISLMVPQDVRFLRSIERFTKQRINPSLINGLAHQTELPNIGEKKPQRRKPTKNFGPKKSGTPQHKDFNGQHRAKPASKAKRRSY